MNALRIVAADNIKGGGVALLQKAFGVHAVEARDKYDETELCEALGQMDALVVRSATTVTRKAIEAASPRLKVIGRAGVGTDNIDKEAATERGIVVMNTPLGNTISAAEHAIALLFATARNIARADALMQQGAWAKKKLKGVEVHEKTLGLVGLGKIGTHVARVMKAAGMSVVAYDPYLPAERAKQIGVELSDLDDLLGRSDFVSIHTPLTDKTRNLLDAKRLKKMKKGARLVNCARGGIVDEAALAEAVKSGRLSAAGLDVFASEPMTEGPLLGVQDLTLTPHLGASTAEAGERCGVQMAEQLIAYFQEGIIRNAVNIDISADPSLKPYVEVAHAMGKIAGTILNAAPEGLELSCSGELEAKDTGEITAAALSGLLKAAGCEDVNVVNAQVLAKSRGIAVSETSGPPAGFFVNRVDVAVRGGGKECRLGGTAYNGVSPRIIQVDDADMDIRLNDHMLLLRYPDQPGYVGKFGTLIAEHNINIANMEVGCLESRKRASMVIGLSEPAPKELMDKLLQVEGVERAYLISL